jgi:hypothetical protein
MTHPSLMLANIRPRIQLPIPAATVSASVLETCKVFARGASPMGEVDALALRRAIQRP